MNYYAARPFATAEGWHFTVRNDDNIWPVGYCAEFREDPKHVHATADEAADCFRRYLLDGQREEEYGDWTGCEALVDGEKCDVPTKKGLTARPPLGNGYALCDEHRTAEHLDALTPPVGTIAASY